MINTENILLQHIFECRALAESNDIQDEPNGWEDLFFYDEEGTRIRYGYAPACEDTEKRGTIVLTHGYDENIDLYYETMRNYQERGFDVYAMNFDGHRRIEENIAEGEEFLPSDRGLERHADDLAFFMQNVVNPTRDQDKPVIMSTHSMGGHIGLLFLRKHPEVFDGAVMSAPMLDIYRGGMGDWARPALRGVFNAASWLGLKDVRLPTLGEIRGAFTKEDDGNTLRGLFYNRSRENDEDTRVGRPTWGWVSKAYETIVPSMEEEFLSSISTPVLIGSAENDDLVANDAHERAAEFMQNTTNVMIPNARHGLWFEDGDAYSMWWDNVDAMLEQVVENFSPETDPDAGRDHIVSYDLDGNRVYAQHNAVDPQQQVSLPRSFVPSTQIAGWNPLAA